MPAPIRPPDPPFVRGDFATPRQRDLLEAWEDLWESGDPAALEELGVLPRPADPRPESGP